MVHRLNQHSLSPLDAWCICLCSQPHICQCLWYIALHINVCSTCHYVHVQLPCIIFCQQIYYVQQCRCFFCISCGTWLVSIGSNGISMISYPLGFGLGVCVCVFVRASAYWNLITVSLKYRWCDSLLCQRLECHQCKQ